MPGTVINVRGSNASGKTTTVREFISLHPNHRIVQMRILGKVTNVTECVRGTIYALGRYDRKNGGCDAYDGRDHVFRTIEALVKTFEPTAIIYEGMLYSKTYKMTKDMIDLIKPYGYDYKSVYLRRPFASTIQMLESRNDGNTYNIRQVHETWEANERVYEKLLADGVNIRKVNPDGYTPNGLGKLLSDIVYGRRTGEMLGYRTEVESGDGEH